MTHAAKVMTRTRRPAMLACGPILASKITSARSSSARTRKRPGIS
jgi:hypothetical protein